MPLRIEEIIQRIRREIAAEAAGEATDQPKLPDVDALAPICNRPEREYINRNWMLLDPQAEMRSHRRILGPIIVRFKWWLRRLVIGVLERYFEKERSFLLELVRFNNALAERSDRTFREVTERTKAVADRNDLFLTALDMRLEALEARQQLREALVGPAPGEISRSDAHEALLAEMATALAPGLGDRIRPFLDHFRDAGHLLVLGCGGGEIFRSLDGAGAAVVGVEASSVLVAECRSRGIDVKLSRLRSYLDSVPEGSLGGIILTGVADRHPLSTWPELVAGAWRALGPGGVSLWEGLPDRASSSRLRWLLARQRFSIVDACAVPDPTSGIEHHVVVVRRGEAP